MQNNFFGEGFSTTEFSQTKNVQRKNHKRCFCVWSIWIYIYICVYIYSFTRHVYCTIAIRLQVKGGNFQPNRFPRETNKYIYIYNIYKYNIYIYIIYIYYIYYILTKRWQTLQHQFCSVEQWPHFFNRPSLDGDEHKLSGKNTKSANMSLKSSKILMFLFMRTRNNFSWPWNPSCTNVWIYCRYLGPTDCLHF